MSGASLATVRGAAYIAYAVATISLRAGSKPASANVLDLANEATFDGKEAVTSVATGFALS